MATIRQGYSDDFTIKNSKVGIGTSDPTDKVEVVGGTRSKDIAVTGIATLTSYQGFQNKNTSYTENVNIAGGESGTLSGEIVVGSGLTMSVGTAATSGQGNIECMKVYDTFNPPCGGTANRPAAAKPGTIYYNKDFRTIEYWDGNFWRQVDNTTTSGRAIWAGGRSGPADTAAIVYSQYASKGTAQYFGDLLAIGNSYNVGTIGNNNRGIFAGNGPSLTDVIQYITPPSTGNAIDFGNLTSTRGTTAGASSSTRGLILQGYTDPAATNVIDYIEISTIGNAIDFGDLTVATYEGAGLSSPTRGLVGGGSGVPGPTTSNIDVVTIASKGNATKFGELLAEVDAAAGCSNGVRGVWAGGENPAPYSKNIQFVNIASDGNAVYFGDLTIGRGIPNAASNRTIGLWAGGFPGALSSIEFINISTSGNGQEFGDLTFITRNLGSVSDSHGGLGGF